MRLGHHGPHHGQRLVGPEMADADDDDAALDAEVAPRAVDALLQGIEPGAVGDAERRRPLGRAEHLDILRALARRARRGRNRARRRNRAAGAGSCTPGRRRRGSSGSPARHRSRRRPSGRPAIPGHCASPARAPVPAGSSLRDGSAARPWESRKPSQWQVRPLQPVVGRILGTRRRSGARHRHAAAGPTGWARWHAAAARAARPACRAAPPAPPAASRARAWHRACR